MKALLDRLRERAVTLTLYNYDGSTESLETLATRLEESGIAVTTDTTGRGSPTNFGVFHRGDELLETVTMEDISTDDIDFESLLDGEQQEPQLIPTPETDQIRVSPETSRQEMVGISRTFERRAHREGSGKLLAGFQNLSVLGKSERTRSVYDRLADAGVSVTVYGYPDTDLGETPFEVVADTDEEFRDYWFLLYDGGDTPERKSALVSREQEASLYDSFWTADPETVEELFSLAREQYPDLVSSH